jgi:hypothetical protein
VKVTKTLLKQIIKEELEEMQNTDSMRDFETEIGVLIEKAIALAMEARLSRVHEELMGL